MAKEKMNPLVEQIKQKIADRYGIETDIFCDNDLEIYTQQIEMLKGLKQALLEDGYVVEKTYAGGKANKYSHPAIADYNKTADSSHKTVNAIRKFIKEYGSDIDEDDDDLMKILNGGDEDAE